MVRVRESVSTTISGRAILDFSNRDVDNQRTSIHEQLVPCFFDFFEFGQHPFDKQRLWVMQTVNPRCEVRKVREQFLPPLTDNPLAACISDTRQHVELVSPGERSVSAATARMSSVNRLSLSRPVHPTVCPHSPVAARSASVLSPLLRTPRPDALYDARQLDVRDAEESVNREYHAALTRLF